ncbi:hypothetical protein NXW48_21995 [Phocaeicola vulgatus]|nr:hypothetical protein [Phocaeicola vulgatus]
MPYHPDIRLKHLIVAVREVVLLNVSDRPAAEDGRIKNFILPRVDDAIGVIGKSSSDGVPCRRLVWGRSCRQTMPGCRIRMLWMAFARVSLFSLNPSAFQQTSFS